MENQLEVVRPNVQEAICAMLYCIIVTLVSLLLRLFLCTFHIRVHFILYPVMIVLF